MCLLIFMAPKSLLAFDAMDTQWSFDFMYHYSRIERATTTTNVNFLSRGGGMLQFEYTDNVNLFWRYYLGGDVAFAQLEAPGYVQIDPRQIVPWQGYGGIAFQVGELKSLELFLGAGFANEFYQELTGVDTYDIESANSIRVHAGFSYRFLSVIGNSATIMAKYSIPVTTITQGSEAFRWAGILDGTLRLRFAFDSNWSIYGGIRFEDYETVSKSLTYFTTRIYAGIGVNF